MSNEQRPQLRFGRGGPVDDSTAALRIAFIVVCLLNPITACLTMALVIIGRTSFVRRIPAPLIPLIGAVACIGGWAFGWTAMYLGTYRDAGLSLLDALINALRINGPDNAASTPGEAIFCSLARMGTRTNTVRCMSRTARLWHLPCLP